MCSCYKLQYTKRTCIQNCDHNVIIIMLCILYGRGIYTVYVDQWSWEHNFHMIRSIGKTSYIINKPIAYQGLQISLMFHSQFILCQICWIVILCQCHKQLLWFLRIFLPIECQLFFSKLYRFEFCITIVTSVWISFVNFKFLSQICLHAMEYFIPIP